MWCLKYQIGNWNTYSWLRRKWNSSPVVIVGAENEEYCLTLDDIDSCLVYMYTPVTEEGVKGEPQYAITDYVKAGHNFYISNLFPLIHSNVSHNECGNGIFLVNFWTFMNSTAC